MLTTACDQDKWSTEQPTSVEVLEFFDMLDMPNTTIDIYTKNRDGKLPLMIIESPMGIESYDLLDYSDNLTTGDISFRVESIDVVTNELQFVAV